MTRDDGKTASFALVTVALIAVLALGAVLRACEALHG